MRAPYAGWQNSKFSFICQQFQASQVLLFIFAQLRIQYFHFARRTLLRSMIRRYNGFTHYDKRIIKRYYLPACPYCHANSFSPMPSVTDARRAARLRAAQEYRLYDQPIYRWCGQSYIHVSRRFAGYFCMLQAAERHLYTLRHGYCRAPLIRRWHCLAITLTLKIRRSIITAGMMSYYAHGR